MTPEKRSRASLRILSSAITAESITALLQTQPSRSFEVGAPLYRNNPQGPRRESALWLLESGLEVVYPLNSHLENLVSFIEEHGVAIDELRPECKIGIFCFISSEGDPHSFTLNPTLLQQLALHNIFIRMTLLPPAGLPEDSVAFDCEEQNRMDREDAERWRTYLRTRESIPEESMQEWLSQLAAGENTPPPAPDRPETG